MIALKFDVLDMIREPDNYTSGERAHGSDVIAELIGAVAAMDEAERAARFPRIDSALARLGGAE